MLMLALAPSHSPSLALSQASSLRPSLGSWLAHAPPALHTADLLGPVAAAVVFVAVMSLVAEPARRNLNAILVAGACGVYLSGGLGPWELVYPAVGGALAYLGLRSYRAVGVAWLLHAGWDLVHHLFGNPIWPFMPTSSFGCLVFDSIIAIWFLAGAPSVFALLGRANTCSHGELVGSQGTHRRAPPSVASSAGARARPGRQ